MSRYSGFALKIKLSQHTPQHTLDILTLMFQNRSEEIKATPDHPFFRQRRWDRILCGRSSFFKQWGADNVFTVDQTGFILRASSSTTGYPDGMKYLLMWLAPWIIPTDDRIAISQDEESYKGFNEYRMKDGTITANRCTHNDAQYIREWETNEQIMSAGLGDVYEYDGDWGWSGV